MKAIVFDNAGTIIKRVSALKDMNNKNFIFETNTIDIVNKNDESLILVFQTPTKNLVQNNMLISDYLKENLNLYEISYSTKNYSKMDVITALQDDKTTLFDIKDSAIVLTKKYDIEICSGSALIVNIKEKKIDYVYTAGGIFFEDTLIVMKELKKLGYHIFIASGDNKQSLLKISDILNIPCDNIYDTCDSNCKKNVVQNLQKDFEQVIMVGNNTNDYLAIKQADIGILSTEQGEELPYSLKDSSDFIITRLGHILKIINEEGN